MPHVTRGFIEPQGRLRTELGEFDGFEMVELAQGMGLVYLNWSLADALEEATEISGGRPFEELEWLEAGPARWAHDASRRGPIAYIETRYAGGFVHQVSDSVEQRPDRAAASHPPR